MQNPDEEIEKIIERKVKERLQKQKEELKKEILKETRQTKVNDGKEISRRSFLKKLGAGAVGLTAATLIPNTAALDIKDDWGLQVYQNGTEYLDVRNSGVEITNTNLNLNSNDINSIAKASAQDLESTNSFTDPSGTTHTSQIAETSQLYTDNDAVNAADSQIDNTSSTLAGLDDHVANLITGVSSVNGGTGDINIDVSGGITKEVINESNTTTGGGVSLNAPESYTIVTPNGGDIISGTVSFDKGSSKMWCVVYWSDGGSYKIPHRGSTVDLPKMKKVDRLEGILENAQYSQNIRNWEILYT